MATVTCVLNYKGRKVTRTYQIEFGKDDRLTIVTGTPGIVLKGENPAGKTVIQALRNQNGKNAEVEGSNDNEYDVPTATATAKRAGPRAKKASKAAPFTFSVPAGKVAKVRCGYRVNGKFRKFPNGLGQQVPPIP